MINVEIKSDQVQTKAGVSAKTGKPYSIREQEGYAQIFGRNGEPAPYPVRITLALEDGAQAYAPGQYTIDPRCVYVDRFGGLTMGRVKLVLRSGVHQVRSAA